MKRLVYSDSKHADYDQNGLLEKTYAIFKRNCHSCRTGIYRIASCSEYILIVLINVS